MFILHPGITLQEYLKIKWITEEELSKKMNIDINYIRMILEWDIKITEKFASKLEEVLWLSKNFWLELQRILDRKPKY